MGSTQALLRVRRACICAAARHCTPRCLMRAHGEALHTTAAHAPHAPGVELEAAHAARVQLLDGGRDLQAAAGSPHNWWRYTLWRTHAGTQPPSTTQRHGHAHITTVLHTPQGAALRTANLYCCSGRAAWRTPRPRAPPASRCASALGKLVGAWADALLSALMPHPGSTRCGHEDVWWPGILQR